MTTLTASKAIGGLTAAGGAALLLLPKRVAKASRGSGLAPTVLLVRVLGARYLAQGAVELRWPSRPVFWGACLFDGLHGASMVAAAVGLPGYRRAAVSSLVAATVSVLCTAAIAERVPGTVPRSAR